MKLLQRRHRWNSIWMNIVRESIVPNVRVVVVLEQSIVQDHLAKRKDRSDLWDTDNSVLVHHDDISMKRIERIK